MVLAVTCVHVGWVVVCQGRGVWTEMVPEGFSPSPSGVRAGRGWWGSAEGLV